MTGFSLEDEFIERTEKNLQAIEELREKGAEVFEVTQLINSLLGLLVYPREKIIEKVQEIGWEDMEHAGWPLPTGGNPRVSDLKTLVRFMRNSVAHCSFELIPDQDEIIGLRFRNNSRNMSWAGEFKLDELKGFV
ncbi:MAG: HEPN family nuclease, partial [Bacillota bacterium]